MRAAGRRERRERRKRRKRRRRRRRRRRRKRTLKGDSGARLSTRGALHFPLVSFASSAKPLRLQRPAVGIFSIRFPFATSAKPLRLQRPAVGVFSGPPLTAPARSPPS